MFTVTSSSTKDKIKKFIQNQNQSNAVGKTQNSYVDKLSMLDKQPRQKGSIIHVGKIRNYTECDVVLTLLDPKYKYNTTFTFSDQLILKAGCSFGVDLSKAVTFEQSSGYTPLFQLKKYGSEYMYKIYAHMSSFVVFKFKVKTNIGQATTGNDDMERQVARYIIGDENNRCINIQMFVLECCAF